MLFDLSDAWAQSADPRTAEGQTEIKPLKIGDTIPEEFWDKQHTFYRNGSLESKTLTAFKGTPLIIDFWSSWCGACVASLKKIDSLKATPIGKINFLIVTSQSPQNVDQFVSTDKQIKKNAFESIVSDKILSSYFEYRFLPHVIWINSQGVVVSSSISHYVNASNIMKLTQDMSLDSIPPKVENIHFDPTKLLNNSEQTTYSTVFTGIPGVKPQTIINDALDDGRNRTAYINYPALYLYRISHGIVNSFPKSQIVIHVDSFRKNYLPSDPRIRYEWRKQNLYTYESIYPVDHTSQGVAEQMRYDLDTFFNVSSSYIEKLVDCIVITSFKPIQNDTAAPSISLDVAVKHLNDNEYNRVIINEAKIQGRIPLIPRITDWSQTNILTVLKDLGIEAHISPRHVSLLEFEERGSEI